MKNEYNNDLAHMTKSALISSEISLAMTQKETSCHIPCSVSRF